MTTYLSSPKIIAASIPQQTFHKNIIALFLALALSLIAFAHNNPELDWKNPVLESGVAGKDGAIYRFSQVSSNIDALVTIKGRSSALVSLVSIDLTGGAGWDKAWQPQVSYNNGTAPGAAEWWMEFEIKFVTRQTSKAATVSSFDLTGLDIDGNGDRIKEYITFYELKSYQLELNSLLSAKSVLENILGFGNLAGKRFDGPTVNFKNIDTSGTAVMVTNTYQNANTFHIKIGGVASAANGASGRMYSLYFKDFTYQDPVQFTLPLVLNQFTASLDNQKVILNWETGKEKQLSHFVIERSTDGIDYSEVGVVIAGGNSNLKIAYNFTDKVNTNAKGILYYRLKMEDFEGHFQNSEVRLIRLTDQKEIVSITTYPNPVNKELRITIPQSWQNKQVTYYVYNASGQVVKRIVNSRAGQTEVINVQDINVGLYFINVSTGSETAVQRIVKTI